MNVFMSLNASKSIGWRPCIEAQTEGRPQRAAPISGLFGAPVPRPPSGVLCPMTKFLAIPFTASDASAPVRSRITPSLIVCSAGRRSLLGKWNRWDLWFKRQRPINFFPVVSSGQQSPGNSLRAKCARSLAEPSACFVYHNELVNKHHKLFIHIHLDRLLFVKSI